MEVVEQLDEKTTKYVDNIQNYKVLQYLDGLRKKDGKMCDTILKVDGENFPVHRTIVAASSDYFKAMFRNDMREKTQKKVKIRGISAEAMDIILTYIYTGKLTLDKDNVQKVLQASNFFLIQPVKEKCCVFLKEMISEENCLGIMSFAEVYHCEDLLKVSKQFLLKHFENVTKREEFLALTLTQVAGFLERDDIAVECEERIYEAVMRWIKRDFQKRKLFFPELIKLVRLPLISSNYLVDNVESNKLFQTTPSTQDLLTEAFHYHLLPQRRHQFQNSRTRPRNYSYTDETLLAIGGSNMAQAASVFSYETMKDRWCELPKMNREFSYHNATECGGQMFVTGGLSIANRGPQKAYSETLIYDVVRKTWRNLPPMNFARSKHSTVECNGLIYCIGGYDQGRTFNSAEVYNPTTNRWSNIKSMPTARRCMTAVSDGNNVYVVGGYNGSGILDTVLTYNTTSNEWNQEDIPPMNKRRSFPCAVVVDHQIYVIGGYDGIDTLQSGEIFHLNNRQWRAMPPMEVARSNSGASVLNRRIYVVGGWDGYNLSSMEMFDTVEETWQRLSPLPSPTTSVRCCFLYIPPSTELKPLRKETSSHKCMIQ